MAARKSIGRPLRERLWFITRYLFELHNVMSGFPFYLIRGSDMFFTSWPHASGNSMIMYTTLIFVWDDAKLEMYYFLCCSTWQIRPMNRHIWILIICNLCCIIASDWISWYELLMVSGLFPDIWLAAWSTRRRSVCTHSKTIRIITQIDMLHSQTNYDALLFFPCAMINSFHWTDAI